MAKAEVILRLCDRFHKLPSEIMREDAELLQLIAIEAYGKPDEQEGD